MSLPPVLLLLVGVPMVVLGVVFVVRFFQRNRLGERPIEPKQRQTAKGPVSALSALLGALLISIGSLMSAFGIAAMLAGPGT